MLLDRLLCDELRVADRVFVHEILELLVIGGLLLRRVCLLRGVLPLLLSLGCTP
jgi:hypothetical protein